jgi:hypothetical protein
LEIVLSCDLNREALLAVPDCLEVDVDPTYTAEIHRLLLPQ